MLHRAASPFWNKVRSRKPAELLVIALLFDFKLSKSQHC